MQKHHQVREAGKDQAVSPSAQPGARLELSPGDQSQAVDTEVCVFWELFSHLLNCDQA